jgi:hypothetical protein
VIVDKDLIMVSEVLADGVPEVMIIGFAGDQQ